MITRTWFLTLAVLLIVLPVRAQNVYPEETVVTPDKRQRIEQLLEVTGALNIAKMMSEAVTRNMTNAVKQARPDIPSETGNICLPTRTAV